MNGRSIDNKPYKLQLFLSEHHIQWLLQSSNKIPAVTIEHFVFELDTTLEVNGSLTFINCHLKSSVMFSVLSGSQITSEMNKEMLANYQPHLEQNILLRLVNTTVTEEDFWGNPSE